MSDISQGEGWWQASDHKWYPPEQHPSEPPAPPEAAPPETVPPETAPPETAPPETAPPAPAPPASDPPAAPPPAPLPPETAPPAPEAVAPAGPDQATVNNRAKRVTVAVAAAALVAIAAFVLLSRDDGEKGAVVASSSSNSTSSSSSSPEPTASTHRTEAELRARLITAKDLGGAFSDDTFGRNIDATTLCGTPNPDGVVPPAIDAGSAAKTKTGISFQEEIAAFDDVETARRALDLDVGGFSCATGITADSSSTQSFAFQKPRDRSTDLGVENATEIDFQSSGFHGQIFIVRVDVTVLQFAFVALDTSDTSAVPDATSVVSRALERLAS